MEFSHQLLSGQKVSKVQLMGFLFIVLAQLSSGLPQMIYSEIQLSFLYKLRSSCDKGNRYWYYFGLVDMGGFLVLKGGFLAHMGGAS